MQRAVFIILAAIGVGVLHATFFSALPWPLSSINLPLIVILALIGTFRFRDALLVSVFAGVVADLLSMMPLGTYIVVHILVTVITIVLFTRTLTNHSWFGLLSINAIAFGVYHALLTIVRLVRTTLIGFPPSAVIDGATFTTALAVLGTQLAAVCLAMFIAHGAKRIFARFFFTR